MTSTGCAIGWPMFSEKEVIIGNHHSPIGVCTMWSPREEFVKKHLSDAMDKVALVGNLYSIRGIGILIRNFLSNPWMRYLLVTGTEMGVAKAVLQNLANKNFTNKQDLLKRWDLEEKHIKRFLEQVSIVYATSEHAKATINNGVFRQVDFEQQRFEPIVVPLPEPKAEVFPGPKSGYLIRVPTVMEGYVALLKEIRLFGHITGQDSEGQRRQEIWKLDMVITGQDPCDFASIPHPEYGEDYIKKYCEDFWKGTEPKDLAYRYGHTIRYVFGDQVKAIIRAFEDKEETFRTVISLWDPHAEYGSVTAKDPPCIVLIHPRIINGCLHQFAYIRTNDMLGGWPLNAAALRYFQYCLLDQLKWKLGRKDLQIGDLAITSGSAHIYERDWLAVDAMLEEKAKTPKFLPDPKGNFHIQTEDGEIAVNHYSPDGAELLQVFRGKNAEKLSREIAPFISEVRNALYVGRALMEAEMKLRKEVAK